MVTLINKTARPLIIVLDHPAFWKKRWGYKVVSMLSTTQKRDGAVSQAYIKRKLPGSLTLGALQKLSNIPAEIEGCLQVRTLTALKYLEIVKQDVPMVKKQIAEPPRTLRGKKQKLTADKPAQTQGAEQANGGTE